VVPGINALEENVRFRMLVFIEIMDTAAGINFDADIGKPLPCRRDKPDITLGQISAP
jgi:hypothetical protein